MPPTKLRRALCPACRADRPVRVVGTATVALGYWGTTTLTAAAGTITGTSNAISVTQVSNGAWSGYVVAPGQGVTAVGASWVQPAVSEP